jgi:hypothetical protein
MPFRDDLEAARARTEALAEENEVLRHEVVTLRARSDLARAAAPPEPAPLPSGLDALTEATLARLDADADAAAPSAIEAPEPIRLPSSHPPPPRFGQLPALEAPLDVAPRSADPSGMQAWMSHRHRAEELEREIAEVRAAANRRLVGWSAALFLIGTAFGALLAR